MSDLVRNPEDRFSHVAAHIIINMLHSIPFVSKFGAGENDRAIFQPVSLSSVLTCRKLILWRHKFSRTLDLPIIIISFLGASVVIFKFYSIFR